MMKDKQEKTPVNLCGYTQRFYKIPGVNPSLVGQTDGFKNQKKYGVLDKKMLDNGYIEEVQVKDYPINSDSVSSLMEGADYKNDPLQAMANAPVRVNLGDITQAQEFLKNPQNFARIYDQTKQRLAEYYAQQREINGEKQTPEKRESEVEK